MTVQAAYSEWAATYDTDENFTRDLDQQATRDTLGQQQFERILELGCGYRQKHAISGPNRANNTGA